MKEWKYTFEPISKTKWLEQAEKDLKGKSFESLQSEWWPGETLVPVHFKEDLSDQIVSLPGTFFQQPPLLMEWIDVSLSDGFESREKIIRALEYGAQALVLDVNVNKSPDFDLLLKGVFTDIVELAINILPDQIGNEVSIPGVLPPGILIRLNRNTMQSSDFLKTAIELQDVGNTKTFQFIYSIGSGGNWAKNVVEIFKILKNDLDHWVEVNGSAVEFFQQCILKIEPEEIYFQQIIQTRVLQLLWIHFASALDTHHISPNSIIECHIRSDEPKDPDQYLIRAATSTLAAAMTGVKAICIHHLINEDIPSFYQRINRNIHHLLTLESGIYKGTDPLTGSYTIDYYTKKWTRDILEQIRSV